jgi:hypothetical protein
VAFYRRNLYAVVSRRVTWRGGQPGTARLCPGATIRLRRPRGTDALLLCQASKVMRSGCNDPYFFPLALEGGPLWKPLCYAQIGGLAVATFITLLLVPVFYAIFVLDLKWITWGVPAEDKAVDS